LLHLPPRREVVVQAWRAAPGLHNHLKKPSGQKCRPSERGWQRQPRSDGRHFCPDGKKSVMRTPMATPGLLQDREEQAKRDCKGRFALCRGSLEKSFFCWPHQGCCKIGKNKQSGIAKGGSPFAGVRGVPGKNPFSFFLPAAGGQKENVQ